VLTRWGSVGGEVEDSWREWMRKVRKSSWEREQWIVAQEKEVRIGIRK
jgi:hypothetical protein